MPVAAEFTRPQPAGVGTFRIPSNLLGKPSDQEDQRGAQAGERNQPTGDRRPDPGEWATGTISALARFHHNICLAGPIKKFCCGQIALAAGRFSGLV